MGWECPFCHAHKACHCDCDKRLVNKYEELQEQLEDLQNDYSWRKVEDSLPDFDTPVLTFNGNYDVCYRYDYENNPRGLFFVGRKYYDSIIWYRSQDERLTYNISHWMPFPKNSNE